MLALHNVEFSYRRKRKLFRKKESAGYPVLKGVSLDIQTGGLFGLVGPNGSGKTTLSKLTLGVYEPDAGQIFYNGSPRPNMSNSDWKCQIGWISGAATRLFTTINLKEHLALYRSLYAAFDLKWLELKLEELGLDQKLAKGPTEISFGERIKFELALTLAYRPKLLILDEPTVGLDPMAIQQVRKMISKYVQTEAACGILTSHNLKDITEICETGGFLKNGVIDHHFQSRHVDPDLLENQYREVFGSA